MKRLLLLILLNAPALVWAQNTGYILEGNVTNLPIHAKAYLHYIINNEYVLDSAEIKGGKFRFEGSSANPLMVQLIVDHQQKGYYNLGSNSDAIIIYLEPGFIKVNTADSIKRATISGSKLNDEYARFKAFISGPENVMSGINATYVRASDEQKKDSIFTNNLKAKFAKASTDEASLLNTFIKNNPDSYFSLSALSNLSTSLNPDSVEDAFKKLTQRVRNTALGHKMAEKIQSVHSTAIGALAPDFTQNDINGKPVKLSDFKGKYVLLDFWASWCGPCRQENPNVVKAYAKYNGKNFTILGVSLDKDKAAWLKAIEIDGLAWTEISDLKFWSNKVAGLYGVSSIPQNFLIDPAGKIIAVNLRGEDLDKKLIDLLGN